MEVGARWNQSPWIPTSGEMTEVSCRKGAHFLRVYDTSYKLATKNRELLKIKTNNRRG
jgi:hypothetical protein